jgi:hypothetical protein
MTRTLNDAFGLGLSQRSVDFVIPRLDADSPLCIDPFLMFKSPRADLRAAHQDLLNVFGEVFAAFAAGDRARAVELVDFPEVNEVRLGYATSGNPGRGIGRSLSKLVVETLEASPALLDRGLRHVEELQLFAVGIAEDRISDLAANVLKDFLLKYTQEQAQLWGIPTSDGVPLEHIWDTATRTWTDRYVCMPVDPQTNAGILLVPRWIVRRLPWINYDDYETSTLRLFLGDRKRLKAGVAKPRGVEITRSNVHLVERYIDRKEKERAQARPIARLERISPDEASTSDSGATASLLEELPPGPAQAGAFQRVVLETLNTALEPELVDGMEQVRTDSGVEIRDLIFTNNSDLPFLRYLMHNHGCHTIIFECKNKTELQIDDVNQLANYLGDALGYCGFLVGRGPASQAILRKCRATYNKGQPHRVVLPLCDQDLVAMVRAKDAGLSASDVLRRRYRQLMEMID